MNGGKSPSGYLNEWNTNLNTITISEGGNSCGFVKWNKKNFWKGGHCYSIDNIQKGILNTFLYHLLKYHENEIMKLRVGSGLPNIQKRDLLNFKINIPLLDEQYLISNILTSIYKKSNLLYEKINQMKKYKQSLLQQMFI